MEASALPAPAAISRFSVSASLLRLRSDEQLVALFRSGSEEAFCAIHDRYRARLLAYARQMLGGSRQDAEDALQDVFFRAYAALRADERPLALRAWLYRVAHNRCIDQIRRPMPVPAEVLDVSRPPQPDPLSETERREDLRRLVADVRRLPEQQRSALLMRELQGLSYEELSDSLDVSVAAVKSLLVRARSGLVEAADARETACGSIQHDLALACDRGVRASGLARRHLRDCAGCRAYRDELRGVRRRLAALVPVGPLGSLGMLAKGLGIGGSGAAAGGVASGGAAVGGAGSLAIATKVAIVCAAAVTAGGAIEATRPSNPRVHRGAPKAAVRKTHPDVVASAASSSARALYVRDTATPAVSGGTPAPLVHHSGFGPSTRHRHAHDGGFITGQDIMPAPLPDPSSSRTPGQANSGTTDPTAAGPINTSATAPTTAAAVSGAVQGGRTGAGATAPVTSTGSTSSPSQSGSSGSGTSGSASPSGGSATTASGSTASASASGSSTGSSPSGSTSGGSTSSSGSGSTSSGSGSATP